LKDLVEFIARSLVNDPMEVYVDEKRHGSKLYLNLRVAKEDMGRVIGRGGRVANAIRKLLRVAAAREGINATLDIDDPK